MKRVVLKPKRDYSVLKHHPWVFSGAIAEEPQDVQLGETVEVVNAKGERLGFGTYSPSSQIRVRMLADVNETVDAKFIESRVASAVGRRADFFAQAATNAVRLINAENDALPGVVADFYAGWVVCQFTSAGADYWKRPIAEALMRFAPFCKGVVERSDIDSRVKEGLSCQEGVEVLLGEEPPDKIEIIEGPCKFLVDVRQGHKTGFYLDQRDARQAVGALANGAKVLNCFSYTGGFGLFCRACGAMEVTQVDISEEALALAKRNEALQSFCGTKMDYVKDDVFHYLRKCRDEGLKFDMIILDPPKFAQVKFQVMKAMRGYKDINLLAMKLLRPNGILATFSCSGAMTTELFDTVISEAAEDAKRNFQIITRTRQGADHPVLLSFPQGAYLKGLILRGVN